MRVVAHVRVEFDRVTGVVGVVTPISVLQGREQRSLCALVEVLAAHDQSGPGGPGGEVDEIGDLGDMRTLRSVTAAASAGSPTVLVVSDPADSVVDVGVGAGHDREPDVALAAPGDEPCRATSRIGAHLDLAAHRRRVVADVMADTDFGG